MQNRSSPNPPDYKAFLRNVKKRQVPSVTDEELQLAFEALGGKDGILTVEAFAQKVKDFKIHNFRELIGESGEITFEALKALLSSNEDLLQDDPIEQSMKFFDTQNSGNVDLHLFKVSLEQVYHIEITDEEMNSIIAVLDADGDGNISFKDWGLAIETFNNRPEVVLSAGLKEIPQTPKLAHTANLNAASQINPS